MNKLGFGFLRLPKKPGTNQYDWPLLEKMTDEYLASGHNYFDTAYTYLDGWSEIGLRECLVKRHARESFRIADKLPGYMCRTYEDCKRFFDEQLERCGVEYFDVYMLHWLNASHCDTAEKCNEFRFLAELKERGLAGRIGFSYHDNALLLDRILTAHPEVDIVQLQINYLDWDSEGVQSRKCYEVCVKHGKSIVVMEPVKGGTLANLPKAAEELLRGIHPDWSNAAWALRFASALPQVETVLSGMNSMEQMTDNLREFEPLSEAEISALEKVADIINANTAVPCTGCRYCVPHCPQKLLIPDYFKMYNELMRFPEDGWKIRPSYKQTAVGNGKASDCISCGACTEHCPQKIEVPKFMKQVADMLE